MPMKYFSIQDWKTGEPWDRIQADEKRYRNYVETIRHTLPPDLQRLCDFSPGWHEARISLNDCQVQGIRASYEAQTVTVIISGGYDDAEGRQVGLRRFTLNYTGVTEFQINAGTENAYNPGPDTEPQNAAPSIYLSGGIEFDDHGWDEIELVEDNLFEHRMLFASGTETAVRFHGFTLETIDVPHEAEGN